ncbi:MAG: hypothetical protein L0170_11945 [Acidobacteria bacterium]|nr:hypothetical protein [Acidobacteriota bacterium]
MLMSLLLLSWVWDRVVKDCHGGPETIRHYYLRATMRQIGTGMCPTGQGNQKAPCTAVLTAPPVRFGPDIGDPGTGTTVLTYVDPVENPNLLPIPPVGGLAAWPWATVDNPHPVVAVDMSMNRCDQACP